MTYLKKIRECLGKLEIADEYDYLARQCEEMDTVSNDLAKMKLQMKDTEMTTVNLYKEKVELEQKVRKNCEDMERMKYEISKVEESLSRQDEQIIARKEDQSADIQSRKQSAASVICLCSTLQEYLNVQTIVNRIDNDNWEIKFVFAESKYVLTVYNAIECTFELRAIQPSHVRFEAIRQFLNESQDMPGFLAALRKNHFFSIDNR